jgi:hypothetical protein
MKSVTRIETAMMTRMLRSQAMMSVDVEENGEERTRTEDSSVEVICGVDKRVDVLTR